MSDSIRIKDARCTDRDLEVRLNDGRAVNRPLSWFPTLASATQADRARPDIVDGGRTIEWRWLHERITLEEVLRDEPQPRSTFVRGAPLTAEDEEWQLETWRWLLDQLGGIYALRKTSLVLPTMDYFPNIQGQGHARAEQTLAVIKGLVGLQGQRCKLVAQPERPDARVSERAYLKFENQSPLGTFGMNGDEVTITYDPALLTDQVGLVATLAHELSHYRFSTKGEPPGGPEYHEFSTDLGVVFMGFGLFGAATAFRYYSGDQGWGYQQAGYLDQDNWAFALAVFLALRNQTPEDAEPWLTKYYLTKGVTHAAKYLAKHPQKLSTLLA